MITSTPFATSQNNNYDNINIHNDTICKYVPAAALFAESIELVGHVEMSIILWNPPNKQYYITLYNIQNIYDERRWIILEIHLQTRETKLT